MKNIIMVLTLATFMVSINCASWKQVNANNPPTEQSAPRWAQPIETTWSEEPVMEVSAPIVIDDEIKPALKELKRLNGIIANLESYKEERTLKLDTAEIGTTAHNQLISEIDTIRWKILNKKKSYNGISLDIGMNILESQGLPNNFEIINNE